MQVRIDRPATPPLQGLAAGTLDPAGLARIEDLTNCCQAEIILYLTCRCSHTYLLLLPPPFSLLAWHGMAICPTCIHVVLVYVAHVRRAIPALPSSQLTNPAAAPRFFLPRAQCSHQSPRRTIWNPPSNSPPTPPQSRFKHHRRVCGTACVRWDSNSHRPGARVRHKALSNPQPAFQPPKGLTRVEGIQVGRIASQHPFAGRRALALRVRLL